MQHRENILVDFRRQFDYIDFTCIATSCFQNVYDNALTTTHTHTHQTVILQTDLYQILYEKFKNYLTIL